MSRATSAAAVLDAPTLLDVDGTVTVRPADVPLLADALNALRLATLRAQTGRRITPTEATTTLTAIRDVARRLGVR